jgi:hypothetical protein
MSVLPDRFGRKTNNKTLFWLAHIALAMWVGNNMCVGDVCNWIRLKGSFKKDIKFPSSSHAAPTGTVIPLFCFFYQHVGPAGPMIKPDYYSAILNCFTGLKLSMKSRIQWFGALNRRPTL